MSEQANRVRAIERERLRSLVEVDLPVARSLHAADFQLITPRGTALTKAEYLDLVTSGLLDYRRFEPTSDIEVLLGDRVASLRYTSWIENVSGGEVFSAQCWHTDCYRFGDSGWQAVWSQATRVVEAS